MGGDPEIVGKVAEKPLEIEKGENSRSGRVSGALGLFQFPPSLVEKERGT